MNGCPTEFAGKLNQSTTLGDADQVVVQSFTETLQSGQSLEFSAKYLMANKCGLFIGCDHRLSFRLRRQPVKIS